MNALQLDTFDLTLAEPDVTRAQDFLTIDATIGRLAARKRQQVDVQGPLLKSKLAWKVATYQQAVLYRVVALAEGTRLAWNAGNFVLAILAARALTETIAVFDEFESTLDKHLGQEDLSAIDGVIMNRTFATRDEKLICGSQNEILAINVLTFIDKLERRYKLPIRTHYESLSERCHPNSAGHHQMYSTTDYVTGAVSFSEAKQPAVYLDAIRPALGLVAIFEQTMDSLDKSVLKVADLQDRRNPVR